jgi:hypothetical protein
MKSLLSEMVNPKNGDKAFFRLPEEIRDEKHANTIQQIINNHHLWQQGKPTKPVYIAEERIAPKPENRIFTAAAEKPSAFLDEKNLVASWKNEPKKVEITDAKSAAEYLGIETPKAPEPKSVKPAAAAPEPIKPTSKISAAAPEIKPEPTEPDWQKGTVLIEIEEPERKPFEFVWRAEPEKKASWLDARFPKKHIKPKAKNNKSKVKPPLKPHNTRTQLTACASGGTILPASAAKKPIRSFC